MAGEEKKQERKHQIPQEKQLFEKNKNLGFNVSALCGYLDFAIICEVSQGGHDLGHCGRQRLLYCFLLSLGDSGEAWQQVDQVGSGPRETEAGIRMQTEESSNKHLKRS